MKEENPKSIQPEISKEIIAELTHGHPTVDEIRDLLRDEGLLFSDDSVRNITYALLIFREIGGNSFKEPFFIYGSTAKGTAGVEPKFQEIQFWQDMDFMGSVYRAYGMSDLDIRCISSEPSTVLEKLNLSKKNLSPFTLRPAGIRIEDFDFVRSDIAKEGAPSFYRRVLLLNKPIVLGGEDGVQEIVDFRKPYFLPEDVAYENEMGSLKALVRSRLENSSVIFLSADELTSRYPVYYNRENLVSKNFQRTNALKISFGLRKSSLISVRVDGIKEIGECMRIVTNDPFMSFEELKRKI